MMMESFTGMIQADDPDGDRANGLRDLSRTGAVLPVRLGAAPVGMGRLRPLSRARADPRRRAAVPDHGSPLGIRVLSRRLLSRLRRPPVDPAAGAGDVECDDAAAGVHIGPDMVAAVDRGAG